MVFESTVCPCGVGDFSGFSLPMHALKWGIEVGIWLVPSFLRVISSGDILLEMLRINLKENSFQFNGKHYLQTHGTAMGTKTAVSFAKVTETVFLDTVVYRQGTRFNEKCILDLKTFQKKRKLFSTHISPLLTRQVLKKDFSKEKPWECYEQTHQKQRLRKIFHQENIWPEVTYILW